MQWFFTDSWQMAAYYAGEKVIPSGLQHARYLGKLVVDRLERHGFIRDVTMSADDYTPWKGYVLTEKGNRFVQAYKGRDYEGKREVMMDWNSSDQERG